MLDHVKALESQLNAIQSELESLSARDTEAPTIVIDSPAYTTGGDITIKATFDDTRGLFKVLLDTPSNDESRTFYAGEQSVVLESSTRRNSVKLRGI